MIEYLKISKLATLHESIVGNIRASLENAIEAGRILTEIKIKLNNSEFTAWVERNLSFDVKTAQHYMEKYEFREKLKDDNDDNAIYLSASEGKEHQLKIIRTIEDRKAYQAKRYSESCQICGEKRITNQCHVVPRMRGGPGDEGNILILCPTHHFLFDHARLGPEEFQTIDFSNLSPVAREYYYRVHLKRHKMWWNYRTNRFSGCTCGSTDFCFDVRRDNFSVSIVLVCQQCGEIWHNVWEENHPITLIRALAIEARNSENPEEYLENAERCARDFLENELHSLLNSDK